MHTATGQLGQVLPWLDLAGIAVFALSGALAAAAKKQQRLGGPPR